MRCKLSGALFFCDKKAEARSQESEDRTKSRKCGAPEKKLCRRAPRWANELYCEPPESLSVNSGWL
jgi:hypothetical protein